MDFLFILVIHPWSLFVCTGRRLDWYENETSSPKAELFDGDVVEVFLRSGKIAVGKLPRIFFREACQAHRANIVFFGQYGPDIWSISHWRMSIQLFADLADVFGNLHMTFI